MKLSYFKGREKVCTINSKYISNASKCAAYLQKGELLKIEFELGDIDDTVKKYNKYSDTTYTEPGINIDYTDSDINIEQERK